MSGIKRPEDGWMPGDAVVWLEEDGRVELWKRGQERYSWTCSEDSRRSACDDHIDIWISKYDGVVYVHAPRPEPAPVGGDVREALLDTIYHLPLPLVRLSLSHARTLADAILARFDVTPRDGDTVRVPRLALGALRFSRYYDVENRHLPERVDRFLAAVDAANEEEA